MGEIKPQGRGGSGRGQGRKKREAPPEKLDGRSRSGQNRAGELLTALNSLPPKKGDTIEVAGWRRFWDSMDHHIALDARKYLYDKDGGKAIQTVNHLHDKPIEHNHTVSIRGTLEKALQRALKR